MIRFISLLLKKNKNLIYLCSFFMFSLIRSISVWIFVKIAFKSKFSISFNLSSWSFNSHSVCSLNFAMVDDIFQRKKAQEIMVQRLMIKFVSGEISILSNNLDIKICWIRSNYKNIIKSECFKSECACYFKWFCCICFFNYLCLLILLCF